MKKLALLVVIILSFFCFFLFFKNFKEKRKINEKNELTKPYSPSKNLTIIPSPTPTKPPSWTVVYKTFQKGISDIDDAIQSRDLAKIGVAFDELVYSEYWRMAEAKVVLEHFLKHEDARVRFLAARQLYLIGETSGYEVMISLMKSPTPVPFDALNDLRLMAAQTIAKYRVHEAKEIILDLNVRIKGPRMAEALTQMGYQLPNQSSYKFIADENVLRKYGKTEVVEHLPLIQRVFAESSRPEQKMAAAWTLAHLQENQAGFQYLKNQALRAVSEEGGVDSDFVCEAVKYVGSIYTAESKEILEQTLDSPMKYAVQVSIVNLIFNHGGSPKVNERIAKELVTAGDLPLEFLLLVGAQLQEDPLVREAGEKFQERHGKKSWDLYAKERIKWPIYNWVDEYVVKLKDQK